MIRDHNWYNSREQSPWPLDEASDLVADDGTPIPFDVLADLYVRFPSTLGTRARLGALYVGPAAVSVIIMVGDTPIASVSLAKPVEAYVQYQLSALVTGVGGWIVFGEGASTNRSVSLRFSDSTKALLIAQVARKYTKPPVTNVGSLQAAAPLTGLVSLIAGDDLELVNESVEIDGIVRNAIVFNLSNKQTDTTRNLYSLYSGPCGGRPETGSCGDPRPVEGINTVTPNCCGDIFIELRGCADLSRVQNATGGVILDCGFGLSDACVTPKRLPDASGKLPNEYDDQCTTHDEASTTTTTTSTTTPAPSSGCTLPSDVSGLPWSCSFETSGTFCDGLTVIEGTFTPGSGSGGTTGIFGGKVDIIIPEPMSGSYCTIVFDSEHGLIANDQIVIHNNAVSAYNNKLAIVQSIDSPTMATLVLPYTSDGDGGIWFKCGAQYAGPGGGYVNSMFSIVNNSGNTQLLTYGANTLDVGEIVQVIGNSVSGYNTLHTITTKLNIADYKTNQTFTSSGSNGFYILQDSGSGGSVASIAVNPSNSKIRVTTGVANGLAVGDQFLMAGSSVSGYNTLHTVTEILSATVLVTDVNFISNATGGGWYCISRATSGGGGSGTYLVTSASAPSNILLWTTGIPEEPAWASVCKQIETVVTLNTAGPGVRYNGGIVVDYREIAGQPNYIVCEITRDSPAGLNLWQVRNGAWYLISHVSAAIKADKRYKLRVDVNNYADYQPYVAFYVTGIDDGLSEEIFNIALSVTGSSLGTVGLISRYAKSSFEYFTVRKL